MDPIQIPQELVPPAGQLTPGGFAYVDAFPVRLQLPPDQQPPDTDGNTPPMVALPRTNQLIEASVEEVRQLARNGWRFWLRYATGPGGAIILKIEPMVPLIQRHPFLDSGVQDPPPEGR